MYTRNIPTCVQWNVFSGARNESEQGCGAVEIPSSGWTKKNHVSITVKHSQQKSISLHNCYLRSDCNAKNPSRLRSR